MNAQDFIYISKRVFRKMAIPFLLFFLLCAFLFMCFFNNQSAYANSSVANLKRTVNLINNSSSTLLIEDSETLSNIQHSALDLNNLNLTFQEDSKLMYKFEIESIANFDTEIIFKYTENKFENVLIEYELDGVVNKFDNLSVTLPANESVCVIIWISIENPNIDAVFNGNIELSVN